MSWCLFVSSAISTIGNKEMLITIGIYTIGFVQEVPLHGKKLTKQPCPCCTPIEHFDVCARFARYSFTFVPD